MNIAQRNSPNFSSRGGWKPDVIVCHITDGAFEGAVETLCLKDPNNPVSTHFVVARDSRVAQLVDIRNAAWCNGTQGGNPFGRAYVGRATSPLVRQRKANANSYTISIECEGFDSTHGILTTAQFNALVELVKYIKTQVKQIYGTDIPVDRSHIIGHCEIDPRDKPNCPGRDFPYDRLIAALNAPQNHTVIDKADSKVVTGWALNMSSISRIDVYADNNAPLGSVRSFSSRPDVARVYPQYPNASQCGYSLDITGKLSAGTHQIKVAAIGANNSVDWQFATVTIQPAMSVIDQANANVVSGWALNQYGMQRVDIYADNNLALGSVHEFSDRPDVARVYPGYPDGAHCGYSLDITGKLSPGSHTIKVASISKNGYVQWQFKTVNI